MDNKKNTGDKALKEKTCFNCLTKETPLWRRSKKGANLCNACGLYYRNHGEHRPAVRSSDLQNQIYQNQDDDDGISSLEQIAIRVLSEMRNYARETKGSKNRSFDHYENKNKINQSDAIKTPQEVPWNNNTFEFKTFKQRFRTVNTNIDEHQIDSLPKNDSYIEQSQAKDIQNKKFRKNSKFLNFYNEINRNNNSDYGCDSSTSCENIESEHVKWHIKPENGKMYGDPMMKMNSSKTRSGFNQRSGIYDKMSQFYNVHDSDSNDFNEQKSFARNPTILD